MFMALLNVFRFRLASFLFLCACILSSTNAAKAQFLTNFETTVPAVSSPAIPLSAQNETNDTQQEPQEQSIEILIDDVLARAIEAEESVPPPEPVFKPASTSVFVEREPVWEEPVWEEEPPVQTAQSGWTPLFSSYDGVSYAPSKPIKRRPAARDISGSVTAATLVEPTLQQQKEAVDFQADQLVHDDQSQIVTATGNVILTQTGRTLNADEVVYNLPEDRVIARGNVVLVEVNGDIHYSDEVDLKEKFSKGFVQNLKSELADGAHLKAEQGQRKDRNTTIMKKASYTPCDTCKEDDNPMWQIKAREVTHDKEEHRISYDDATFELFGVPVAYTPYFAHSDGTVERESGFLAPVMGFRSQMGTFAGPKYYWDIAPDKDATVGFLATTDDNPLAFGQWRQRWDNASLEMNGSVTQSERIRSENGKNVTLDPELRGHILGNALWDMNEEWRSGARIEWASDDQYMRQYDIQDLRTLNTDVLVNEVFAERFNGRNYTRGSILSFQDIRVRDRDEDQPEVLPEIITSLKSDPNAVPIVGGNWELNGSFLGLRRDGSNQDINRANVGGAWKKRLVSDYGLLTNFTATARGDLYNVRDRDVAVTGSGQSGSTTETRLYANVDVKTSYPIAKDFKKMQMVIEPVTSLTLSPNVDVSNDIPNEDSRDVQLDISNLFEANRFSGLDRIEDKSKVTYGLLTGFYGHNGSRADLFIGQSYRLEDDDNPFPEGSGLNTQDSDIVGRFSATLSQNFLLNYRFQLNNENLASERHEVDSYAQFGDISLSTNYLYAAGLEGTDISESREQLNTDLAYRFDDHWRFRTGGTQDFGEQAGLRRAFLGLDFIGQCLTFSVLGQRNLTAEASGDSSTEILFRIGLKNMGEFEDPDLRYRGNTP